MNAINSAAPKPPLTTPTASTSGANPKKPVINTDSKKPEAKEPSSVPTSGTNPKTPVINTDSKKPETKSSDLKKMLDEVPNGANKAKDQYQ